VLFRSFDFNQDIDGGTSFKARHKDWQGLPIVEDFSRWTMDSLGLFCSTVEYAS